MKLACLLFVVACGPSADAYDFVRPEAEAPDPSALADHSDGPQNYIENEPLEPWDTTGAGPLSGIFAVEIVLHAKVVVDVQARGLARVRLLQRGRTVHVKSQLCRLLLPKIENVVDLTIPLPAERVIRSHASENEGDFLSADALAGAALTLPPLDVTVGAKLADPEHDPLPTSKAPASESDDDGDGEPGVTLGAKVVLCARPEKLYVALRTSSRLDGMIRSPDAFDGPLDVSLEQSVLGWTNPCLAAAADLKVQMTPGSTFRAVRVGPKYDVNQDGNVTCGEIVLASPALFGDAWKSGG